MKDENERLSWMYIGYLLRGEQAVIQRISNICFLHLTSSDEDDLQIGTPLDATDCHVTSSLK